MVVRGSYEPEAASSSLAECMHECPSGQGGSLKNFWTHRPRGFEPHFVQYSHPLTIRSFRTASRHGLEGETAAIGTDTLFLVLLQLELRLLSWIADGEISWAGQSPS